MKISELGVSVVPKREKGKGTGSVKEPIFGKYVGESIAALQESIIEAERRFGRTNSEYDLADKSYGSVNWKVLAGAQGMSETVEVFWKVGRRSKVALFEDDAGNMVSTIRVRQTDVKGVLRQMLAVIADKDFEKCVFLVFHFTVGRCLSQNMLRNGGGRPPLTKILAFLCFSRCARLPCQRRRREKQ